MAVGVLYAHRTPSGPGGSVSPNQGNYSSDLRLLTKAWSSRMWIRCAVRLGLLSLAICMTSAGQSPSYWPSAKWRTALPETQGINSQALAAAIDQVMEKHLGVHSLLVIRHGYAVVDATFYP